MATGWTSRSAPIVSPRVMRLAGFALQCVAAFTLIVSALAWWTGQPFWATVATSLGLAVLGLALIVGRERPWHYYTLVAVSFALWALAVFFSKGAM